MKNFNKLIKQFPNNRILVFGDCMLDEWLWGKVSRISPEAPVPVVEIFDRTYTPGGAANVVNNLVSLGGRVTLAGLIGEDDAGKLLKSELKKRGVDLSGLLIDSQRPTTTKIRIVAHTQQVCRADREVKQKIDKSQAAKILQALESKTGYNAVLLSDYGKGVLNGELLPALIKRVKEKKVLLTAGPKPESLHLFKGVDLVSLNQKEAATYVGYQLNDGDSLCRAGEKILEDLECRAVLITRGEYGMSLFTKKGEIKHIPAIATEVYDVSGAGDTVIATLTMALACGADLPSSMELANYAAAVVVRKVGTATLTPQELIAQINDAKH